MIDTSSSRASDAEVHQVLTSQENKEGKKYTVFIASAHALTEKLKSKYLSSFICIDDDGIVKEKDDLELIEILLAAHAYQLANPVVKEAKADGHSYKLNVVTPRNDVLGTSFGQMANALSDGKLLLMEKEESLQEAFIFAC